MPTWNSNTRFFPAIIKSILTNIPVCHLIIIDRFSSDGTREVIKRLVPEEKLILKTSRLNQPMARRLGITLVDTEWFAFIDSDILICKNWYNKIKKHIINNNVGAIQGIHWPCWKEEFDKVEVLMNISEVSPYLILRNGLFNLTRGLTTCTLIRTELVKDWFPPPIMYRFGDLHITQHIIRKGYKWLRVYNAMSYHMIEEPTILQVFRKALNDGAGARLSGMIKSNQFFSQIIGRTLGALLKLGRDPVNSYRRIICMFGYILGYINPERFRKYKR